MAQNYSRKGVGEITTIEKPGVVTGTMEQFYSKAEYDALKKSLARLDKEFPQTAATLRNMIDKVGFSDAKGLDAFMKSNAWSDADRLAMHTVGLEGTPMQQVLKVKTLVPKLPNGPELFLSSGAGRPVNPSGLKTVTNDLRDVLKTASPEAKQELKQILSGATSAIKNKELGNALTRGGLAHSDTLVGPEIQLMRANLMETLAPEMKAISTEAVAKVSSGFLKVAGSEMSTEAKIGLQTGKAAVRGATSLDFTLGLAALAVGPMINYFTEQKEKAALAPGLLAKELGKEKGAQAYQEYKLIMTGQLITSADPTMLTTVLPQAAFEKWADKYNLKNDVREKLMPESLLFRAHTPEERMFAEFYDRLPTSMGLATPKWLEPYVHLKQQIVQETFDLNHQKFSDGLLANPRQLIAQIQKDDGIDGMRKHLMEMYSKDVDGYETRLPESPIGKWLKTQQEPAWSTEGLPKITIKTSTPKA